MDQITNREAWLEAAVEKLRPLFLKYKFDIPPVKVTCGFASRSARKALGECSLSICTDDGTRLISVSPAHKSDVEILATLVHELIHSCLDDDAKHGPKFKEAALWLGLEGRPTATVAGLVLMQTLEPMAEGLGKFPNPIFRFPEKTKKERAKSKKSFRMFCEKKRNCDKHCSLVTVANDGGDDYKVTASRKSLQLGFPMCPCGNEMNMEEEDHELYKLDDGSK